MAAAAAGAAAAAVGAGVAAAAAGVAAAAGACGPCLYQGVRPRFACIHDSFFQSSVCQSGPTMPPTSLLLAFHTHLRYTQRPHSRQRNQYNHIAVCSICRIHHKHLPATYVKQLVIHSY